MEEVKFTNRKRWVVRKLDRYTFLIHFVLLDNQTVVNFSDTVSWLSARLSAFEPSVVLVYLPALNVSVWLQLEKSFVEAYQPISSRCYEHLSINFSGISIGEPYF